MKTSETKKYTRWVLCGVPPIWYLVLLIEVIMGIHMSIPSFVFFLLSTIMLAFSAAATSVMVIGWSTDKYNPYNESLIDFIVDSWTNK